MTAEQRKYLLKVVFFPVEGLKCLGMTEKQIPCSSSLPGVLGGCFDPFTVPLKVSLTLPGEAEHSRLHRFLGVCGDL